MVFPTPDYDDLETEKLDFAELLVSVITEPQKFSGAGLDHAYFKEEIKKLLSF